MVAASSFTSAAFAALAALRTCVSVSSVVGGLPDGRPTLRGRRTSRTCFAPGTATASDEGCQLSLKQG